VLHRLSSDLPGRNDFHVTKPDVGIESGLLGFPPQLDDLAGTRIMAVKMVLRE
jgi:hypothetical protein